MSHTPGLTASARHRLIAFVGVFAVTVSLLMAIPATPVQSAVQKPSDMLPDYGALVGATSWPRDGDWSQNGVKRRWEYIEDYVGRDLDIGHERQRLEPHDRIVGRVGVDGRQAARVSAEH